MNEKKAIIYQNTETPDYGNKPFNSPAGDLHTKYPRGYAYIQDDSFVHIYGDSEYPRELCQGWILSEKLSIDRDIEKWAVEKFGANEIKRSNNMVGEVISGVWRPGHNPSIDNDEKRYPEQTLRILLEKLDDLFLYIEPSKKGLKTYSHKTRELLILACTEIENIWKRYYLKADQQAVNKNLNTKEYVKLKRPLFLDEYEVTLRLYERSIRPFFGWNGSKSTRSLPWYDAYNKTKHNMDLYFKEATLLNCISAITGNIVLFCAQYGPSALFQENNILSGITRHLFSIKLVNPNPKTFYIPKIRVKTPTTITVRVNDEKKQDIIFQEAEPIRPDIKQLVLGS